MSKEYVDPPKMSGEDLCELIVEVFKPEKDGRPMTTAEVWNSSPRGELWHVASLGMDAYAAKNGLQTEINFERGPNYLDVRFFREVPDGAGG